MILIMAHDAALRKRWRQATSRTGREYRQSETPADLRNRLAVAPDALVLFELRQPDELVSLLSEFPCARFLVLSPLCSDAEGESLVRAGVRGYLPLDVGVERLGEALGHLLLGEMWLPRHLMEATLQFYQQATARAGVACVPCDLTGLTPRQQEVAQTLVLGLSNKAIAQRLNISERTVKAHLSAIFERTHTQSRTELVLRLNGGITR